MNFPVLYLAYISNLVIEDYYDVITFLILSDLAV